MNVQELMRTLNLTEDEAKELIEYDREVDNGKTSKYDLDKEHAKVAKEMTNMETHKHKAKSEKPTEDTNKSLLIDQIATFLEENDTIYADNVQIINAEREVSFEFNGNTYQLLLIQKRK